MATAENRKFLLEMLQYCARQELKNPICFVTKCHIPNEVLTELSLLKSRGLNIIVYISYSGLCENLERGINRTHVRQNFRRIADVGIPLIHYWRPIIAENATLEIMREVHDYVSRYAECSVATGLKLPIDIAGNIAEPPEFVHSISSTKTDSVWPKAALQNIATLFRQKPEFPVFFTTIAPYHSFCELMI